MMRWAAVVGMLLLAAQTTAAAPNWSALDAQVIGYGVFGPPTAYLIDRKGRLVARMVGDRDWSKPAVKNLLLEVLKQPAK